MRPLGFPACLRIKQRREFLRVQRRGRKHHVRHFMVFVLPRLTDPKNSSSADVMPTRLGITVTRKVGNAVVRNRIKRLVREVFRLHRARLPPGLDIVWVAKQQAVGATFAQVLDDFEALLRRSELTGPPTPRSGKAGQRSPRPAGPTAGKR